MCLLGAVPQITVELLASPTNSHSLISLAPIPTPTMGRPLFPDQKLNV